MIHNEESEKQRELGNISANFTIKRVYNSFTKKKRVYNFIIQKDFWRPLLANSWDKEDIPNTYIMTKLREILNWRLQKHSNIHTCWEIW